MTDQTPEAILAAALHHLHPQDKQWRWDEFSDGQLERRQGHSGELAAAVLAALPPDAHLFTVDSLATALAYEFFDLPLEDAEVHAAALIKAAKEASDESSA